jgi:putative oxygen-independent coproporphyrinogen III oxidase
MCIGFGPNSKYRKRLGLYLHIPFCKSKCAYCDFFSFVPTNDELVRRYINALVAHMEDYKSGAKLYSPDTIFIGGGTPTSLPTEQLLNLIKSIYKNFDVHKKAEFTIEANPATVHYEMLRSIRKAGVNRISFGLQSGDNKELLGLTRHHNRAEFEQSYRDARRAKFENINIDLMYGIPLQTKESFLRTLRYAVSLRPEHISMYGLKIEEGTPFAVKEKEGSLYLPEEDTQYEMYITAVEFLENNGYPQYEISNFSRPGYECRHNLKYWNCEEYLGIGASAHSYFNGSRFSFKRNIDQYMNGLEIKNSRIKLTDEDYAISQRERVGEWIMLRMRLNDGVDTVEFENKYGLSFDEVCGNDLQKYIKQGFVTHKQNTYAFTPKGMFVSNYILSDVLTFHQGEI